MQRLHERVEAHGKAVDVEIQRIVVAVADVRIDGGVEGRNEPMSRPNTRDRVEERQPVVLRGRKARRRRLGIVARPMPAGAAPRLDQLDVDEQPFETAVKIRRALELSRAPGDR